MTRNLSDFMVPLLTMLVLWGCSGDSTAAENSDRMPSTERMPAGASPFDAGVVPGADGNSDAGLGSADAPVEYDLSFTLFDEAVEQFIAENQLRGASAVVVHEDLGEVHRRGYGELSEDRVYLVASASKILSVGVILRLSDQGLVDLDAPVSSYLSAWGTHKTDLTLAQMLSNSTGMVGLLDDPYYLPYLCQYTTISGSLSDCARSIYTASDDAGRVPPDTTFRYGGGQWQMAGGVAEVVSGKTWAELVQETYAAPCGTEVLAYTNQFQNAALSTLGGGATDYPRSFDGDISKLAATDNPSIEGGAYLTVQDYGRILMMHLRGGRCGERRVLSEQAVARMQRDRIGQVYGGETGKSFEGYGLGWWVDRDEPGVVLDPGAYGAAAYLDLPRGYGAFIAVEAGSPEDLYYATKPTLDAVFTPL